MGILNMTPDSFSGDGHLTGGKRALARALGAARRMIRDGADIIDVGGESTRPGSCAVSVQEEIARVAPVIRALVKDGAVPVAVDTYKPEVAEAALEAGASIVNVIQGTPVSGAMLKVVRTYDAGIILMHMRGNPSTMQAKTRYRNITQDILQALQKSVEKCLKTGIKKESIVVDPGFGFAKTVGQNLSLLKHLSAFKGLGLPVLAGVSRKSFIGKTLGVEAAQRLQGTAASVTLAIQGGAHIIRVHDVRAMKQVALMSDAVLAAE
ncbi:MAG: dihydropteroate synthase [Candidatus Omnitrophica bacterium]|nr:dihydropteroate synthase [Candidatus Omnitrophota bacterium]